MHACFGLCTEHAMIVPILCLLMLGLMLTECYVVDVVLHKCTSS